MPEARVKVKGATELVADLDLVRQLLEKPELVTKELKKSMSKFAPKRTGALRASLYYKNNVAGAKAPHAGWVELMGDEYEYAKKAIDDFKTGKYADQLMEPL